MAHADPREPRPDLSIIIVSWNTQQLLRDCLASLFDSGAEARLEVFVVDNDSRDGSPDMVAADFPAVKLIRNSRNAGFAAANNQAIRMAAGRHVLLLNSDTLVHPGVIDASIDYMDANPQVGAMGCRVLNGDGTVQTTCSQFPTLGNLVLLTSGLFRVPGLGFAKRYRMDDWQRDEERDVEVVSGCYMMVRGDALAMVGLLDEDFFFFGEETDWCRRFLAHGYAVRFAPVGTITHFGGGSSKSLNSRRDLMLSEATVRLHRKHGGIIPAAAAWAILLVFNTSRYAFWSLRGLVRRSGDSRRAHFRGVVAGFNTAWPRARQ
ncbi:glycosyltransferase family 2 protein [Aestuariivirga litoralis]|uniref:Glycosyltransferase family 2 protein n=1 Tax=Aestuariivirga litoralis TaxID=2650924 RepID=A0A2W2B4Q2_9HYPH|nr:glycosyltransferase family 2 protein [Aestuariivirga litoralis]PZF75264.1 glycosyltransferase family 2 protein [Aestuariivirga litoralis]